MSQVEEIEGLENEKERVSIFMEFLGSKRPSQLMSHPADCCRVAREWFLALSGSYQRIQVMPPVWIANYWKWGPNPWPLFWCEAVGADRLDCGGLAALARTFYELRNDPVYPVQLIQAYTEDTCGNWSARWCREKRDDSWMMGNLVYHEAVGVEMEEGFRLWDPTEYRWIEEARQTGPGRIVAVRISPPVPAAHNGAGGGLVLWNGKQCGLGDWVLLD